MGKLVTVNIRPLLLQLTCWFASLFTCAKSADMHDKASLYPLGNETFLSLMSKHVFRQIYAKNEKSWAGQ